MRPRRCGNWNKRASRTSCTGAWDVVAAAGIPKSEVAVLWGFPTHTNSVVEVNAPAPVPQVIAPNQIQVAVHGPIDPATVVPFVVKQQPGTVVLMDLDAVAKGDLVNGLPVIDAQVVNGNIVITGQNPFPANHTIGLFFTNGLHDPAGIAAGRLARLRAADAARRRWSTRTCTA